MIGTAKPARGQIVRGHVELAHYPDGPVLSPVVIADGERDGPTLWLQACIHGPEVVGPLSIQRFLKNSRSEAAFGSRRMPDAGQSARVPWLQPPDTARWLQSQSRISGRSGGPSQLPACPQAARAVARPFRCLAGPSFRRRPDHHLPLHVVSQQRHGGRQGVRTPGAGNRRAQHLELAGGRTVRLPLRSLHQAAASRR